jgi:hypothetical protein
VLLIGISFIYSTKYNTIVLSGDITNIQIRKKTRDRLKKHYSRKGESYDDIINEILDVFEKK